MAGPTHTPVNSPLALAVELLAKPTLCTKPSASFSSKELPQLCNNLPAELRNQTYTKQALGYLAQAYVAQHSSAVKLSAENEELKAQLAALTAVTEQVSAVADEVQKLHTTVACTLSIDDERHTKLTNQLTTHVDTATASLTEEMAQLQQAFAEQSKQLETLLSAQATHTAALANLTSPQQGAPAPAPAPAAHNPWYTRQNGKAVLQTVAGQQAPQPQRPAQPAEQPQRTAAQLAEQPQRTAAYVRLVPALWWEGEELPERNTAALALARDTIAALCMPLTVLYGAEVQRKRGKPIALVLTMSPEGAANLLRTARNPAAWREGHPLFGWRVLEHLPEAEYQKVVQEREALRTALHDHFAAAITANARKRKPARLSYRNQYTTLLIGEVPHHLPPSTPVPAHPASNPTTPRRATSPAPTTTTTTNSPPHPTDQAPPPPPSPYLPHGVATGAEAPAPGTS